MLFSRSFLRISAFFATSVASLLFALPIAQAADVTVCATSCDYPTITDAITGGGFSLNDSIFVGADYASTTETFPLSVPQGVVLDCQSSGAIIGTDTTSSLQDVNSQNNASIQNCIFNNVNFQNPNVDNVHITHNTFLNNSQLTANGSSNLTVSGNAIRQTLAFDSVSSTAIDGNTFREDPGYLHGALINLTNSTSVSITNNDIQTLETTSTLGYGLVNIGQYDHDILVDGNYIDAPNLTFSFGGDMLHVFDSTDVTVTNNEVFVRGYTPLNSFFNGMRLEAPDATSSAIFSHNTIKIADNSWQYDGITLNNWSNFPIAVTSTYNLVYRENASSTARGNGFTTFFEGPPSNETIYSDYNGFGNVNDFDSPTYFPAGPHSILNRNPFFETEDATSSNDFTLAPFSAYLDVNGTEDIGAVSGVRRSTIHVDLAGPVDFSTVDGLQVRDITDGLRTGDTIQIANGTYDPFTVTSTFDVTSSVMIVGSGSGTIIDAAGAPTNAITINGVNAPMIRDLVVQNANASGSQYLVTKAEWVFGGNTYDQSAGVGAPPDSAFFLNSNSPSCDVNPITSDGTDISAAVDTGTDDWNVALLNLFGGTHVSVYVPNRFFSSGAGLQSYFEANCTGPSSTVVDQFIPSIFVTNGSGSYSFNASAASAASATLKSGQTSPPSISRAVSSYSGIKLINAINPFVLDPDVIESTIGLGDGVIQNVTSTNNGYGIWFTGGSDENNVVNSDLRGNLFYDVHSDATYGNDLRNTLFTPDVNGINGDGSVRVWYTARVLAQAASSTPIGGATVTFMDSLGATSSLLTDNFGFTPYSGNLLAYVMTTSSVAVTNGGYNPYTFTVTTSSLPTFATTTNLIQPFQTISMASSRILTTTAPSAPSGFSSGSVATSSIVLVWADTSSGANEEASFLIQVGTHDPVSGAVTYATTTVAADSTSVTILGLLPNVHYTFLIKAVNGLGGSVYQGPVDAFTAAAIPSAPVVSVLGTTSVAISIPSDANASGTLYAIFNSTVSSYLSASGTVSVTPVFQTTSSWSGITAVGLTCGSSYNFNLFAKNGDGLVTAASPTSSVTTDACSGGGGGSSGGGGGGGGGLSTGAGTSLSTTVTSPGSSGSTSDDSSSRLAVLSSLNRTVHDLVKLPDDGNPRTQEDSAVYYLGADGRRHAFSNDKVFASWYCDFSKVAIISRADLAKIPLGKNITYRPGLRLVKFPSVHTVYLVQTEAILHPLKNEATAIALFGADWAKKVSDVSEAFYGDYTIDSPVEATQMSELAGLDVSPTYPSGNLNIPGYQDPGLVRSSSSSCQQTIVTKVAWPFKDIPKTFVFTQYADTNSLASLSIRYLQEVLVSLGATIYPEAKVTGNYGPATQAAVKRFQVKNGLPQSGSLDTATRAKLNAVLNSYQR